MEPTIDQLRRWGDSGLDLDELRGRVAGLSGRINAATCEWLGLVAEADERKAWHGFASCVAWLSWQCGIGPGTASDHVRVARALTKLPKVRQAFSEGGLSFSQVRAMTRARGILDEETLLELARHATGAQLERLVRGLRKAATPQEEDAADVRQFASWRVDTDGSLILKARLSGEAAATVVAALEAVAQATSPDSRAEVFTAVGRAALAALESGVLESEDTVEKPQASVTVVADLDALALAVDEDRLQESSAEDSGSVAWEPLGVAASTRTLATLLCERQVNLIARLTDGTLMDLGRSRRRPSAHITKAVLRRHDHRCAVPNCHRRRHLHLHHVRHWAHGGSTSVANLLPLCGQHHRGLHAGDFSIHAEAQVAGSPSTSRWVFRNRQGEVIRPLALVPREAIDSLDADIDVRVADRAGRAIAGQPDRADPLHLAYAVSVLLPRGA